MARILKPLQKRISRKLDNLILRTKIELELETKKKVSYAQASNHLANKIYNTNYYRRNLK